MLNQMVHRVTESCRVTDIRRPVTPKDRQTLVMPSVAIFHTKEAEHVLDVGCNACARFKHHQTSQTGES
jgi:hypothetical protein